MGVDQPEKTVEESLSPQESEMTPRLKGQLDLISVLAKCLGDENRLRILLCVMDGKKSVSQIVESLNLSQPLVSHHLKELKRTLLVDVERKGPFIFYEIAEKSVFDILQQLETLAIRLLKNRKSF
jgi:DNA-binding transcriptional ArsR family regulator